MVEASDLGLSDQDLKNISAEVLDHSNNPRNYGQMEDAHCIGKCENEENKESVIIYQKIENETIIDISFVSNGCKDMIVSASLFTEMVKGDSVENAKSVKVALEEKLNSAPDIQKDAGLTVLKAFSASLEHINDKNKDMYIVKLK